MENEKALQKATLYTVMTTSFMSTFMGSSVNLALPSMSHTFGSSAIMTSWVVTGYLLASAVFLLPLGRVADIYGRRQVYLSGTVLYTVFSLATALSFSMPMLIACRILQGISAAMIFSTGMAILTSVYPPQKRGQALGLSVAVTYLGLSTGPVLGGIMNHYLGWRSIFFFTAVLGVIAAAGINARLQNDWRGAGGESFDTPGSLMYMTGLLAVLYGLSSVSGSHWSAYMLVAGIILLIAFVARELRIEHPVLQVRLFRDNKAFAFSNLAAMINYSATFAIGFLLSLYLQVVRGYSSQTAGFILLAQPLVMASLSPMAGRLSDRLDARRVASLGMGICALSLFLLVFVKLDTSPVWLVLNLLLTGLGFSLFTSPNTNAIMGSVAISQYGVAFFHPGHDAPGRPGRQHVHGNPVFGPFPGERAYERSLSSAGYKMHADFFYCIHGYMYPGGNIVPGRE
jgi:EmrB/QacA subfamily drug resistance transporter